jgi:hypothetical protein
VAIAIVLLVIAVIIIVWAATRSSADSLQPPEVEVTVAPPSSLGKISAHPDTGGIVRTEDDGWILNPLSTFPLTIYGVDKDTAAEIKSLLDEGYSRGSYTAEALLAPIIARSNLRCKEVEQYVKKFRPLYEKKIEELKRASPEWATASDKDKEDLLMSFRSEAIESLDVQPDCDIVTLFECEPADATIDDALIDRYGWHSLQLYFRNAGDLEKVQVIPANHPEREGFEELVQKGLAIRGPDIPVPKVLESLKLKQMNQLVSELGEKSFSRKSKAVEFLLNVPDIRERLSKVIAFRELFQLKPLPEEFSRLNLAKVSAAWRYAREVAHLIAQTYASSAYETRSLQCDRKDPFVVGWEIKALDDACPYCQRLASRMFPKGRRPRAPLHIGCRCFVAAKYKDMRE